MSDPLERICAAWSGKLAAARRHKETFQKIADQCMLFYDIGKDVWAQNNVHKFMPYDKAHLPRFKMVVAKAFEFVAIYGPSLYQRNPQRTVTPRPKFEVPMELLTGPLPPDPMLLTPQQLFAVQQAQMMQQQMAQQAAVDGVVAQLIERWLNYTPNEQPGGGLAVQAEKAINEALIKGRGCLWTEVQSFPGSDVPLVGSFYDSVDNLLIDPDAEEVEEACWIARKCVHPIWQVEREYGIPQDYLRKRAKYESGNKQGELQADPKEKNRKRADPERTNDLIVYYKVYSKMGIGARLHGVQEELSEALETVFGDYCYLVICPGIPFPLNLPTESLLNATDEELSARVAWPVPFYLDERWPCAMLDFYPVSRSVWPMAPMAPGLAELMFLNVMISHLCGRIQSSCRDFIAIAKSAGEDVTKMIQEGPDQTIIPIDSVQRSINEMVQFLQQPQTNIDVWKIIEAVMEMFDKRVGLTEFLYGLSDTQPRSAEEVATKRQQVSVRPAAMQRKVELWSGEQARQEAIAARLVVQPEHIAQLLGPVAGMLWQQYVMTGDVGKIVREFEYSIAAGSAQIPNKDKQVANATQAIQTFTPVFDKQADVTGDTNPMNALIVEFGKAFDMDVSGMLLAPRMPMLPAPTEEPPPQEA